MPVLTAIRDVAIILLAVESLVIGVLLVILLLEIRSLARLLRDEVRPILASAQETMGTVRGTTTIVSQYIVSPVARVASFIAGLREGLESLVGTARQGDGE